MKRGTLLLVIALAAGCSSSGSDDKALIVQECKDSVQAHLTYDADWPSFDPIPTKDSAGTWHAAGTVTTQNGFAATRTLHWTCSVTADDQVKTSLG